MKGTKGKAGKEQVKKMESKRWGNAQPKSLTLITRICTNSRRRRKLYKKVTKETKNKVRRNKSKKWNQKDGENTKRANYTKRKVFTRSRTANI